MQIVNSPTAIEPALQSACVTIGNFDGVHKGHQQLLGRVRSKADKHGYRAVVVTFDPHPLRLLTQKKTPPFITLTQQKLELFATHKPDACLLLEFTHAMAQQPPEDFVRQILVQGLRVKHLIIGHDYAFGKDRAGNYELLTELGKKYDFTVERVAPVMIENTVVSSTRIRELVMAGDVLAARPLLGRFYTVRGRVEPGFKRGGDLLGFPTANLRLVDELFPATGVYAVWAFLETTALPAVANIGYNPTFGNEVLSVEVHILDFAQDIYGQDLNVCFIKRLRSEKKFTGPDALSDLCQQIASDIATARSLFADPHIQP